MAAATLERPTAPGLPPPRPAQELMRGPKPRHVGAVVSRWITELRREATAAGEGASNGR